MIPTTAPVYYRPFIERCMRTLSANKWRKEFICEILCLFLSLPRRINFSTLARYSPGSEQRFRMQFAIPHDWLQFNINMVEEVCSGHLAIAFDPCFLPKAGSKTPGVGWFWSGCASAARRGLEIGGIAALDIDNHTAMHLEAVQTIPSEGENILAFYARVILERAAQLQKLSRVVVADAYFSKEPFVEALTAKGFSIVSRLRSDAVLRYIIPQEKTGRRGRPKLLGQKIELTDFRQFNPVYANKQEEVYSLIVWSKALKRKIKIIVVYDLKSKTIKTYFSTDITMQDREILTIYRTRFQIEFLYRDAKQHTALAHCQARNENKLHFHVNASLTAVNIAKVEHWLKLPKECRGEFSMITAKTINHNALLLNRFLCMFAIHPNTIKNKQYIKELLLYGTQAA